VEEGTKRPEREDAIQQDCLRELPASGCLFSGLSLSWDQQASREQEGESKTINCFSKNTQQGVLALP